jgi:hypothetical protein
VAYGACVGSRPTDGFGEPVWIHGGRLGLQVWAVPLNRAVWATLLVEQVIRSGPIMLLNAALRGTSDEGAATAWALGLLAACEPGFYVLRAL